MATTAADAAAATIAARATATTAAGSSTGAGVDSAAPAALPATGGNVGSVLMLAGVLLTLLIAARQVRNRIG
jgi:LPXTG-motif cell wall-anchored protein